MATVLKIRSKWAIPVNAMALPSKLNRHHWYASSVQVAHSKYRIKTNAKNAILLAGNVYQTSFAWLALEAFTSKILNAKLNVEMLSRRAYKNVTMGMTWMGMAVQIHAKFNKTLSAWRIQMGKVLAIKKVKSLQRVRVSHRNLSQLNILQLISMPKITNFP